MSDQPGPPANRQSDPPTDLAGRRVFLLGSPGGLTKRELQDSLRNAGVKIADQLDAEVGIVIFANSDRSRLESLLGKQQLWPRVESGDLELIAEDELWRRLSYDQGVDNGNQQLYSPAMLAELLGVSVRTVRRWYRGGLIRPVRVVFQLPYFDYSQIAVARQLAGWVKQGASIQSIERQLRDLQKLAKGDPDGEIAIDRLPVTADGKRLLMREGERLFESNGQLRLGFEFDEPPEGEALPATIAIESVREERQHIAEPGSHPPHSGSVTSPAGLSADQPPPSAEEMLQYALEAEDGGCFEAAIDWYRAALAAYGTNADICFQLAELLYRTGDLSGARERYMIALEIEPGLVEARANLGCVLAEGGQLELSVAAFEGTLQQFPDYADVHFHLARVLDELGHSARAVQHWQEFLRLAPASPWAEEAVERVRQSAPLLDLEPRDST